MLPTSTFTPDCCLYSFQINPASHLDPLNSLTLTTALWHCHGNHQALMEASRWRTMFWSTETYDGQAGWRQAQSLLTPPLSRWTSSSKEMSTCSEWQQWMMRVTASPWSQWIVSSHWNQLVSFITISTVWLLLVLFYYCWYCFITASTVWLLLVLFFYY